MTAIEWLINKLQNTRHWTKVLNEVSNSSTIEIDIIKEAKEMHKAEHEETFKQSRMAKIFEKDMPPVFKNFEQYYNENFKKD